MFVLSFIQRRQKVDIDFLWFSFILYVFRLWIVLSNFQIIYRFLIKKRGEFFFWRRVDTNINVVLKVAFFHFAIRESHFTFAILYTFFPFSNIDTAAISICPDHFSKSMPFILLILSFVFVSRSPSVETLAMLLIFKIVTFICVCWVFSWFSPFSIALFHT